MADLLRIAVVTDIHHGRTSLTKRGDRALALPEEFTEFVEAECRLDRAVAAVRRAQGGPLTHHAAATPAISEYASCAK